MCSAWPYGVPLLLIPSPQRMPLSVSIHGQDYDLEGNDATVYLQMHHGSDTAEPCTCGGWIPCTACLECHICKYEWSLDAWCCFGCQNTRRLRWSTTIVDRDPPYYYYGTGGRCRLEYEYDWCQLCHGDLPMYVWYICNGCAYNLSRSITMHYCDNHMLTKHIVCIILSFLDLLPVCNVCLDGS